jgi:hypothetical protein
VRSLPSLINPRRLNYVSRLSRRDDMKLEMREPGSSYGKRSLGDLEGSIEERG